MGFDTVYDVIVVGGGHAGCEAALVSARMGARTLMINLYHDNVALMACNPSIGGPAKGHLTREISALGGEQARAADASTIHIRWLNTSKGPAVRALRAQCDLNDYHYHYVKVLENTPGLDVFQDIVTDINIASGRVKGVRTRLGLVFEAKSVILTTGTYLGGKVHIGLKSFKSGPLGQVAATRLTRSLLEAGFEVSRMKTGTTPRIHADTVDWKALQRQDSSDEPLCFDYWGEKKVHSGFSCYVTRSNQSTNDIINSNLDRSPVYTGKIEGVGPRYCPSIESKIIAFPEKESHLVFLEPVARNSREIYMQNFSTSLPFDVQENMVHSLPGCEKAKIIRPGYAIEYDYMSPLQLYPTLETKKVKALYCAGQINGTSGYEEAGAQGLIAGINAVLGIRGEEPVTVSRSQGYIGVLIDDLVTKGTREPYRMLTSRCEYRLLLRHDNADKRFAPLGRRLGLLDDGQWNLLSEKWKNMDREIERLSVTKIKPLDGLNSDLLKAGSSPLKETVTASTLLSRPKVAYDLVAAWCPPPSELSEEEKEGVSVEIKYKGYIDRQMKQVRRLEKMEKVKIPSDFDYSSVPGLLSESRQKLNTVKPSTFGQASRISGVTPTDLHLLSIYLHSRKREDHDQEEI
jgi:tRNA uridine 5-carboxymethylaminomethyl modification enzyme